MTVQLLDAAGRPRSPATMRGRSLRALFAAGLGRACAL
jgi:hypothetical protein